MAHNVSEGLMVHVSVTASVKVEGGPVVPLGTALDPQSYTYASVVLDAAGGPDAEQQVDLLPDGGTVVLLGLSARDTAGKPATVTVTPTSGSESGDAFEAEGTLLVASSGVLAALVENGPRGLKLTNASTGAVSVDVLTGRDGA
jgi:hypothetical protein